MAIYAISFRIAETGNRDERYRSVVDYIKKEADSFYWDETTSFFVIHSPKETGTLASNIYTQTSIDTYTDKLLVISLSVKAHASYCNIERPETLKALMDLR